MPIHATIEPFAPGIQLVAKADRRLLAHTNDSVHHGAQWLLAPKTPQRKWIAGLVLAAVTVTWVLIPPADYLPEGNQNFVFAFILPPPGQSIEAAKAELLDKRALTSIIRYSLDWGLRAN